MFSSTSSFTNQSSVLKPDAGPRTLGFLQLGDEELTLRHRRSMILEDL